MRATWHAAGGRIIGKSDQAGPRWLRRTETFALCVLCATGLWGQAARLLPAPFDDWYAIPFRLGGHALLPFLPAGLGRAEQLALYQLLEAWSLALVLPLLLLRRSGVSARDVGLLGRPDRAGSTTLAGILLTVPVGLWLAATIDDPWGSPLEECCRLLTIVPEHLLIFGAFGAALLPARRLEWRPDGTGWVSPALAVAGTALIFGLIHIGGPHTTATIASFPLGVVFAIMTLRAQSIWPAVVAHAALNVVPMAVLA